MNLFKNLSVLCSILLFATTVTIQIHSSYAEVVILDDHNFEHQTQASTGMTTGSWLIFFKSSRCTHCQKLMPQYQDLSNDKELLEKGIVLASLDGNDCPHVMNRFMVRGFPTLMYLHKKKLYEYKGKRDYESLKEFVLSGFEQVGAQDIPAPPSALGSYVKLFKAVCLELRDAAMGKQGVVGYAILVLVASLLSIFGFIISMFFVPAKKSKRS